MKSLRNRTADVLKGISIILVVMVHYSFKHSERLLLGFPFWADMAVPVLLIISGYVSGASFLHHGIRTMEQAYEKKDMVRRLLRYTVPYVPCYFALLAADYYMNGTEITLRRILYRFFSGGVARGGYYFSLMLQFVVIFPLIYLLIRKYDFKGVVICGAGNLLFEILKGAYAITAYSYKYLVFRFLLLIGFGCWLAVGEKTHRRRILPALLVTAAGGFWIWLCEYGGYMPRIFDCWSNRSLPAFLWIMPLAGALLLSDRLRFPPLEYLGMISYDIYLFQMFYYVVAPKVYALFWERRYKCLASVVICILGGIVYHYLEKPLTDFVLRKTGAWMRRWEEQEESREAKRGI